jgi:predicted dehydrogenase
MRSLDRREFMQHSAGMAGALASASVLGGSSAAETKSNASRKGSANDLLQVAVVGVHGRGMAHVGGFAAQHGCVVTTICDADEAVIGSAMKAVEQAQGKAPKFQQDIRKVIEDKSIDIVSIATPNHWHSLMAFWAIRAGKDVYVEKPVSHNVTEGRRVVEAARKYQRICQSGTQCRSSAGMRRAIQFLHEGKLGKVKVARGLCYKLRGSIGKVKGDQPIPKTVNYDLWIGPAPMKPLHRKNLHYDWHWVWDTGNGDLGNQGIHQMDIARWGLNKNCLAMEVVSVGGRFGYDDDGETANTHICVFGYGDAELIFEVRGLKTKPLKGAMVGNIFHCEKGNLVMPGYNGGVAYDLDGNVIQRFDGGGDHFENFVKAVRSRRAQDLNADILEGHLSSALCHLGNISYRLGSLKPFNQKTGVFSEDKEASETFARMEDHLKDNQLKLGDMTYHVGARLVLDPEKESILNRDEALPYLTREYRKGFVVPDKV